MKKYINLINKIKDLEVIDSKYLHLTAFENVISNTAREFLSSKLSSRYYFGGGKNRIIDWNPFTCLGLPEVQDIVDTASLILTRRLHANTVDLRPLSGVHAMICVILSVTNPGDTIMSISHDDGGHFSTTQILKLTGRSQVLAVFNKEKTDFNIKETASVFKKNKCKAIYIDISYCINPVNIRSLRKELGNDAIIIYDASHTIGLMFSNRFQSPLTEGADILCANTHKTLPGTQKALIASKDSKYAEKINKAISSGLVSSSHTHHLIALAVSILEMDIYGDEYATQILENSNTLGKELSRLGMEVRMTTDGVYSHSHQIHLYIDKIPNQELLYGRLVENNISTNFDNRSGKRLFIRIGVQEVTRMGMKTAEMLQIANFLKRTLYGEQTKEEIVAFNAKYTKIHYSFDNIQ